MADELMRKMTQATEDVRTATEFILQYQQQRHLVLRRLAGAYFDDMNRDRKLATHFLTSESDELRLAALLLTRDYWGTTEEFATRCESIAFHDPNSMVRGTALFSLLKCHKFIPDDLRRILSNCFDSGKVSVMNSEVEYADSMVDKSEAVGAADRVIRYLRKMAGVHIHDLLSGIECARDYLQSPDPHLRIAGLVSLYKYHGAPKWLSDSCKEVILGDHDQSVRSVAMSIIGGLYGNTQDRPISNLLAAYVCDGSEPNAFRISAYAALERVQGIRSARVAQVVSRTKASLDTVDWNLVRRNLTGASSPGG